MERCLRIIQSACEQAKQFAIPTLSAPVELAQAITQYTADTAHIFFCDPQGTPFIEQISSLHSHSSPSIVLIAGPEGDLTTDEKELLQAAKIPFCSLTPTILRAFQAIILSTALVRCTSSKKT